MNELRDAIVTQLNNIQYPSYDESDLGNEIGIVLGMSLNQELIEAFMVGLKHGISLSYGTHD
jgi:F0F1-type ATP synthase assembly protein I